jgi:magnesium-transporting ATPase (P-type)
MKTNSIEKYQEEKHVLDHSNFHWTILQGFIFIPPMLDPKRNVLGYENGNWFWTMYLIQLLSFCNVFSTVLFLINILILKVLRKRSFKIIVVFVISIAIYYSFIMGYNYLMLTYVYKRPEVLNHPSQSLLANIVFIILFSILFFLWIISYSVVKAILLKKTTKWID